jgi:hypothetical protein
MEFSKYAQESGEPIKSKRSSDYLLCVQIRVQSQGTVPLTFGTKVLDKIYATFFLQKHS